MSQSELIDIKVFYASRHGVDDATDPDFGLSFAWDIPLLEGYPHQFLPVMKLPFPHGPVSNCYPMGLRAVLAQERFDAVLLHGYMNAPAWAAYWAARCLGLPILLRGESHLHRSVPRFRLHAKSFLLPHALKKISWFLAIGQWNHEYWQQYGVPENRIKTTLYAVENERFSAVRKEQNEAIQNLRKSWGVHTEDTVFAFAGKCQKYKGVDILVEAFSKLNNKKKKSHLVMIGTGPLEEELRAKTRDLACVHWIGFVNQSKMPLYLSAIDVLVLPSRSEPWGLIVNEAMACGVPCIVSDACGCGPDLVNNPKTGLVVRTGNVRALEEAMDCALSCEQRSDWCGRIPAVLQRASFKDNARAIAECLYADRVQGGL